MAAAEEQYQVEQEALRRELEGEDIHITAPKEPEVDPAVYRDVEPLLFRGFLTVAATINDVPFVFKSLNHHEFELLRFMSGFNGDTSVSQKFWDTFLSHTVFMVDGVNILPERERYTKQLGGLFRELPQNAKQRVIRHIGEVNRRASNATTLTEAYFTEVYSRFRWSQVRGLDLTSTAVTGIFGTEKIGMNWAQSLWRALNYYEDRSEELERNWENAKFVGSCMVGKGISKIYRQDTDRKQKEREERLARKDKVLRQICLGEDPEALAQQTQSQVVIAARSVEELTDQLEKDLRGEKDWHDQVIMDHERKIKERIQSQQNRLEELYKSNDSMFDRRQLMGTTAMEGLTPAQVQERVTRSKQLHAQAAARAMVHPVMDEKTSQFMGKWGITDSEVTTNITQTDKDISNVVPFQRGRETQGTPFGKRK